MDDDTGHLGVWDGLRGLLTWPQHGGCEVIELLATRARGSSGARELEQRIIIGDRITGQVCQPQAVIDDYSTSDQLAELLVLRRSLVDGGGFYTRLDRPAVHLRTRARTQQNLVGGTFDKVGMIVRVGAGQGGERLLVIGLDFPPVDLARLGVCNGLHEPAEPFVGQPLQVAVRQIVEGASGK